MLNITFKYAGNGDCIVIDFESDNDRKVGIIDCNKVDGSNPAIDYISNENISQLEFIFLSHHNRDHYSGLPELLEYCKDNEIFIKLFGYTTYISTEYLESVVLSREEMKTLSELYLKVAKYEDQDIIGKRGIIHDLISRPFSHKIRIDIISPSANETDDFINSVFRTDLTPKVSPDPNLVSLVTKIEFDDNYILLTSDAVKDTLKKLGFGLLKKYDKQLKLGQVPHHGSINNHYKAFWNSRNFEPQTPLAISTGPDRRYGHPSLKVIKDLENCGYQIKTTGDISDFFNQRSEDHTKKVTERILALDLISETNKKSTNQDLEFSFNVN